MNSGGGVGGGGGHLVVKHSLVPRTSDSFITSRNRSQHVCLFLVPIVDTLLYFCSYRCEILKIFSVVTDSTFAALFVAPLFFLE